MQRWWSILGVVICLAMPRPARSETKLIAVLPLDVTHTNGRMDKAASTSVEEMLRDVATEALASDGWTVMTGENTLQVLVDNGVDAAKCSEASCHLEMARELKASKFLSGAVQWVDDEFVASIRLIDSMTGRVIATARLEGPTTKSLRKAFEAKSAAFFAKSGLLQSTATPATPLAPSPSPTPRPVVVAKPPVREARAGAPDSDGDGIPDHLDHCPLVPEDKDGFEDEDGCVDSDNDGDGIADTHDYCPSERGLAAFKGCPPRFSRIDVKGDRIALKEAVQFEPGKAAVRAVSQALLEEVAWAMQMSKAASFEVGCHSDSLGADKLNLKLTQQRADAVRAILLEKGVPAHRLTATGYGETMPIDSNTTEARRARNRRVEFNPR